MKLHSYPKIFTVGHGALKGFFNGTVWGEEKADGSQFTFGLVDGEVECQSKGKRQTEDPDKLFAKAVEHVKSIKDKLNPAYTYRGEVLQTPKHNTIKYDRTPTGFIAIFDINDGQESYLSYEAKKIEAERLGLECVPKLFEGKIETKEQMLALLDKESFLGGHKIEGVVFKRHDLFGADGKALIAKYVSEEFKEEHQTTHNLTKTASPNDIIVALAEKYGTEARWRKAIQHLREAGQLEDSPKDIGPLMKEIQNDVAIEECQAIQEQLWKWAWPQLSRMLARGFPQWYKEQLAAQQFEEVK